MELSGSPIVAPKTVFVSLCAAWLVWKVSTIGKRGRLLPPGPPTVPILGNLLQFPKQNIFLTFTEWAQKYGEIVSVKLGSGTVIVVSSPQAARAILDGANNAITSDRSIQYLVDEIFSGLHLSLMRYGEYFLYSVSSRLTKLSHLPVF
jgi:hypothetical protein